MSHRPFTDYYETLEISPNARPDTIHRVYRLLAQMYHPDNAETGSTEAFTAVLEAYRVLSDPERRAAYDVEHSTVAGLRWKIFDQSESVNGVAAEKRKRYGILCLLYNKRLHVPNHPVLSIIELEQLLGCPREHLELSLWYLRESGSILRSDNGRFALTAQGVDKMEASMEQSHPIANKLLKSPTETNAHFAD